MAQANSKPSTQPKAAAAPAAAPAPAVATTDAAAAAPATKAGSGIVLENGERRIDYIRRRYTEGAKRGEIAKELGVVYQIVFAATKGMPKQPEAPAAAPAAPAAAA